MKFCPKIFPGRCACTQNLPFDFFSSVRIITDGRSANTAKMKVRFPILSRMILMDADVNLIFDNKFDFSGNLWRNNNADAP